MTLSAGTRLGPYEIISTLGAGGMGEVYRAVDTRLKREVAIKIVPAALAADPRRLERFQREAEILASLNHPNIAGIFGIEETSAGTALVMELIEGLDLHQQLQRGPIALPAALDIARQVADAIAAAHDRGIVHRDLKPANIKVRDDGRVKVLDFGLAKSSTTSIDERASTVMATQAGAILGTPAYMSPEQARGEATGPQTDIWSFGVVLYELLSGRSPFAAPSSAETIARVIGSEPDYGRLPAGLPGRIVLLLKRCLRKDPKQRLHHIADARLELDEQSSSTIADVPTGVGNHQRSSRTAWVTLLLIATAGVTWWLATSLRIPAPRAVMRAELVMPSGIPVSPYGVRHLAISRDGSRIAVGTGSSLTVRRLDDGSVITIAGGALNPFFSGDGRSIGFFDLEGLRTASLSGGAPVKIFATADRTGGGDWRDDGLIVFATTEGVFTIHADGSQLTPVVKADASKGQRALMWPRFLPGGRSVLLTVLSTGSIDAAQIAVLDLQTAQLSVVVQGCTVATYVDPGYLVYGSARQLKVVGFDVTRQQTTGEPTAIDDLQIANTADNGAAEFDLSSSGSLVYLPPASNTPGYRLWWVSRDGRETPLELPPGRYAYPRVSPDGTQVLLDIAGGANRDVWIWSIPRKSLSQLTSGPTEDLLPIWSPDGARVFFASDRSGNFNVYSRPADGATAERLEIDAPGLQFPLSFTPDGRLLVLEAYTNISIADQSGKKLTPLLNSPFIERLGEVSPDGKWIAYESDEAGKQIEIFVRPYPGVSTRREKISIAGGRFPKWNPKSPNELFYISPDGAMMAARVPTSPALAGGAVTKLFDAVPPPAGVSGRNYDVSPVDGRFLVPRPLPTEGRSDLHVSLVVNWIDSVRAARR